MGCGEVVVDFGVVGGGEGLWEQGKGINRNVGLVLKAWRVMRLHKNFEIVVDSTS